MGAYGAPTLKYTVFLGQMFGGVVLLTQNVCLTN